MIDHADPQREALAESYTTAQQAVLGSILIDSRCLPQVLRIVEPAHFEEPNRYLYSVIVDMFARSQRVDPVFVIEAALRGDCPMDHQALRSYILQLMEITPTAANAEWYAQVVRDHACVNLIHREAAALAGIHDLAELRERLNSMSVSVMDRRSSDTHTMAQAMQRFFERYGEDRNWLPFPFSALNNNLCTRSGDYILLGAESSVGKTALAIQMATYWAAKGKRVTFFSLETDDEDIEDRMMSGFLGVDMQAILRQQLTDTQKTQAAHVASAAAPMPYGIVNAVGFTAADICARCMTERTEIAVIDYLQLIRPSGASSRYGREREVAQISMDLKNFGRRSGVTLFILAQLNAEHYEAVPTLDRIRESKQPRMDADIGFLLFIKKTEDGRDDPDGKRILKLDKNKRGPKAHVTLCFDGPSQLFYPSNTKGPKPLFRLPTPEQMGFANEMR